MLKEIKDAMNRLEGVANRTPVFTSRTLNEITGFTVFVKAENFQRMGAFKFRGAFNAISQLSDEERKRGVITHSSGNHAQAVALACKLLGIKATIVMPNNAPSVKKRATQGYGASIVECEPTQRDREETCQRLMDEEGYVFIHPYDNLHVIQGAATAAMELVSQVGSLDAIIAPVGGGGLLSGTASFSKLSGEIRAVYGAEPKMADDAYRSLKEGKLIPQTNPQTIADGLRTSLSPLTFKLISEYVDEIITVSEEEIVDAMKFLWERMKIVVEPSGAVPLAAIHHMSGAKNLRVGLILSGGNVDLDWVFERFRRS